MNRISVSNAVTSLQIVLAVEEDLAEGKPLLEEQKLNLEKYMIYQTGS
jgi:hypothetical protein